MPTLAPQSPGITIRRMTLDDRRLVQNLPYVLEAWHHCTYVALALSSDVVVGCCGVVIYEDVGLISNLWVADRQRKRGIATLLLERIVEETHSRALQPVLCTRPEQISFYRRRGFNLREHAGLPRELPGIRNFHVMRGPKKVVGRYVEPALSTAM